MRKFFRDFYEISKPDIAYRGVVGTSLGDFDLTHCHRLRPADGGGSCY